MLLQAAVAKDNVALDAWNQWLKVEDYENTDNGSYRLYPLVYHNLKAQGLEDDVVLTRFKGAYRYYWSYNQKLIFQVHTLLTSFVSEGISVILLKNFITYF